MNPKLEEHKKDFAKVWMRMDDFQRETVKDAIDVGILQALARVQGQINFTNEDDVIGDVIDRKQYNNGIRVAKEKIQEEVNRHN